MGAANGLTSGHEADIIIFVAAKYDLLAQLGEHHLDRVGVSGSSPLQVIHIKQRKSLIYQGFFFFFRIFQKGYLMHGECNGMIWDESGTISAPANDTKKTPYGVISFYTVFTILIISWMVCSDQ